MPKQPPRTASGQWTFLSNHAHVLVCLVAHPDEVVREIAVKVGITERAVLRILGELEAAGVITRQRIGRRNHYLIHAASRLRHPLERHRSVGDLLRSLKLGS